MSRYIRKLTDVEAVQEYERLKNKRRLNKRKHEPEMFQALRKRTALIDIKFDKKISTLSDKLLQMAAGTINKITGVKLDAYGGLPNLPKVLSRIVHILAHKHIVIKIGEAHYTLNAENLEKIKAILDGEVYEEISESDGDMVASMEQEGAVFDIYIPQRFNRQRLGGAFFRYTHNLDLDLSQYGIFKEVKAENYGTNCFYEALKQGNLSTEKLNQLKLMISNETTPLNLMDKICEKLNIGITISYVKPNESKKRSKVFGKQLEDQYQIGLHDSHYFILNNSGVTRYALEHYEEVKDLKKWSTITSLEKNKIHRKKGQTIDSLILVRLLLENKEKLLTEITNSDQLYGTQLYNRVKSNSFSSLEYMPSSIKMYEDNTPDDVLKADGYATFKIFKDERKMRKIFFDFETQTKEGTNEPYLGCYYDGVTKSTKSFEGADCGKKLLMSLTEDSFMIAHNARYDFTFILPYLSVIKYVPKGNSLMEVKASYTNPETKKTIYIVIHDSWKFINKKLADFQEMFKLKYGKEVMPYEVYTRKNIEKSWVPITEALQCIKDVKDHALFLANVKKWNCSVESDSGPQFDIIKYSKEYCKIDCEVLAKGYEIFRKQIHIVSKLDIDKSCSIASVAHKFMKKQKCYDGVYELSGVARAFIQLCVVGGRTMAANNKKIKLNKCALADFDAVSLYPSAMSELSGFLKGAPKVIPKGSTYDWLSQQTGYFVKILIKAVQINRAFPLLNFLEESGVRKFTNNMGDLEVYIDKIGLEDAIKFQGIEFEIIEGYYFNEGRNFKVKEVITMLFNERIKAKAEIMPDGTKGNPIQEIYKLLMNSCYGKSILKPIDEDVDILNANKFEKFISRNYMYVKQAIQINKRQFVVKSSKAINEHFNFAQVGCEILSMSKRLMNRVMCLAEDLGIKIYYQDTDSMHIQNDQVKRLAEEYKIIYGKELIGEQMGQFHVDFSLKDANTNQKALSDSIKAVRSIFLGKKSYIDELEGKDKDGNIIKGYHVRMKGIPKVSLEHACDRMNVNLFQLYDKLYRGEAIEFDLTCGGSKFNVQYEKDMSAKTKTDFKRKVKF